jgi:hypothetical protein
LQRLRAECGAGSCFDRSVGGRVSALQQQKTACCGGLRASMTNWRKCGAVEMRTSIGMTSGAMASALLQQLTTNNCRCGGRVWIYQKIVVQSVYEKLLLPMYGVGRECESNACMHSVYGVNSVYQRSTSYRAPYKSLRFKSITPNTPKGILNPSK